MTAPTGAARAGQAYLELRTEARGGRRPVDGLLQLYVLESFLARLAESRFAAQRVSTGGVLLAALGVELSWEGFDEDDPATGRGWVVIEEDGSLRGDVLFHLGDDPGSRAERTGERS
jgi:hypothetical protein